MLAFHSPCLASRFLRRLPYSPHSQRATCVRPASFRSVISNPGGKPKVSSPTPPPAPDSQDVQQNNVVPPIADAAEITKEQKKLNNSASESSTDTSLQSATLNALMLRDTEDIGNRGSMNFGSHRMRVFSGSSNPELAEAVARYVGKSRASAIMRKQFSDGETYVRVDESVRGCNVFVVQPTSMPTNDHLMELLIMIDACRRASAHQVTAVIPYYGYSRADRLIDPSGKRREALTSKLVANMLIKAGTDRVVLVDIHSPQTCGFFDIPVDHVYAVKVLVDYLNEKKLDDFVVVAPDAGGVGRARAFAKGVKDAPLAFIDKRRDEHNVAKVLHLIGDVKNKTAVLVDDMIDTAGTICEAAKMLRACGARQVFALATHAVFSGPAVERLSSGVFEEVIVTDTILLPKEKRFEQLRVLSVANLLGEQIWKIHEQSSR